MHPGGADHPFVEWCWSRYLSDETGTALLTELPEHLRARLNLLGEGDPIRNWQADHQAMSILLTGYVDTKRERAAERFTGLLAATLIDSLPVLIAGLDDADPAVRRLCHKTLGLAGPAAAGAVPVLVRQLYFGPWDERWWAADTLTLLGPEGVDAVRRAEMVGDPQISEVAKPYRHMHESRIARVQRKASKAADLPPSGNSGNAAGEG